MNPLVLRTEEHIVGQVVEVFGESLVPMTESCKRWLEDGVGIGEGYTHWRVTWWQGYNQSPCIDAYPMGADNGGYDPEPFQLRMDVTEYQVYYEVLSELHEDQEFFIQRAIDWEE